MTISAGTRLGTYEINAPIGAGGMGEVYRARDTKLDRDVAIKVLPAELAQDPERLARFEREAKLLASLNHPNIAHVYGFESATLADGSTAHFLAMELVPGEDLAERMKRGAIPVDEALPLAVQIVLGLEQAHEHGIIHRDLKPANVKVTPEGNVKVLDFGLAKALEGDPSSSAANSQLSHSPTMSRHGTEAGMIMGTAAYMSPEQARGKAVDKRADIWAFGVVLFEMLTGARLFSGETVSDTLAAVLREEIPWARLPAGTEPGIRRLLRRCLERNPKNRLHDIADARIALDELVAGITDEPATDAAATLAHARFASPWPMRLTLAVLALTTVGLGVRLLSIPQPTQRLVRAEVLPPPGTTLSLDGLHPGPVAVSPDGRHLAFTTVRANRRSLWVRSVDTLAPRQLPGTEDAQYPFWSPDSKFIGFFTDESLKKTAIAGGPPVRLTVGTNAGKGGSWSPRGVIVFAPEAQGPLSVVSADGGEPRALTELDKASGDTSHRHPRFLPDGEHFLFLARGAGGAMLRIGVLDGTPPTPLFASPANAEYSSGRLLFLRDTTLMTQAFDAASRTLSGEPEPLVENVLFIAGAAVAVFSSSQEGTLTYQIGAPQQNQSRLVWRDLSGQEQGGLGDPGAYFSPRISPDGQQVAVAILEVGLGTTDIWVYDIIRGLRRRLTFDPALDTEPIWAPDGQTLAFKSSRGGKDAIWLTPVAGTAEAKRLTSGETSLTPTAWSAGTNEIVADSTEGTDQNVLAVSTRGGEPRALIATQFIERHAVLSPDGRWLAFESNQNGPREIYVTTFPEPGKKWQVSAGEGREPVWRRDGRALFYRDEVRLHVAEVNGLGKDFVVGTIRPLIALPPMFSYGRQWDVSGDGRRILVVEPLVQTETSPIILTVGWDAHLRKP